MSITYGGDTIIDSSGGVLRPVSSVMRNRIINGAMVIDQRNAGGSISLSSATSGYAVDRFVTYKDTASGTLTGQRSTTAPAGFINSLSYTVTSAFTPSASEGNSFAQIIEGYNVADLGWGTANAKTVTLSFWVQSSVTGAFGGSLRNSGGSRSYPFQYTISSANTWTQISITIPGDTAGTWLTANNAGIYVFFSLGSGSNFTGTTNTWAAANYISATGSTILTSTAGATYYITGVQLEVGTSATGFEYRQYQQELALCQRYYQQGFTWFGKFNSTTSFYGYGTYQVEMRVAPTVTYIAGGAISELAVADRSVTAIPSYAGNTKGGYFQATVSGATSGAAGANAAGNPTVAGFYAEL